MNKELLTGLDLTNQVVGVLKRFRQNSISFMADIEAMCYQVMVPEHQQTFIKFLWWNDHNIDEDPVDFAMCVHVFGGASSASCTNYALRSTSVDNIEEFGKEAADVIQNNFYVDDLLKSVKDLDTAKTLVKNVINMCKSGGFNLTKFISNSRELLISIPEDKRRPGIKDLTLLGDIPVERALGIQWNISKDYFSLNIRFNRRKLTKRVMLSIISSIYDPLGFTSPFVLEGRQLLQHLCNQNVQWDETVNEELKSQWIKWEMKLQQVENLQIPRCLQPPGFGRIIDIGIHHFSDASEYGYGQCSYIRYVNKDGLIHCSLLLGKSRVSPNKFMSIPRLELTTAVLSVKVTCLLRKELQIDGLKERFWTDSQVVLAYIRSNSKRFKVFVANRIHEIKENTRVDQWHYVSSKENPADDASRGLDPRKETSNSSWFHGPSFLWQVESLWPSKDCSIGSLKDDVELDFRQRRERMSPYVKF